MHRKTRIALAGLVFLLIATVLVLIESGIGNQRMTGDEPIDCDLTEVIQRGVLRASTNYNSTNYFVYRGEPMGFHLEMLRHFANHLGVELEITVSNDLDVNFDCLLNGGGCDLIAMDLTVTQSRRQLVQFTTPHSHTRQMLVQRRVHGQLPLRNQLDLAGRTVHVQRNTVYIDRLISLMEEIGDTIYVVEMQEDVEQLIEMVAKGDIDFTISDEQLARLNQHYYANLDVQTPVSFSQHLSWAVRHSSNTLLEEINQWLEDFKQTDVYASLYNKYYNNPRSVYMARSQMHSLGGGKISPFDHYFKEYASIVGWDWRLIASLAFQESRFDPEAVSWAGAFGLMQLMPGTADVYNLIPESPVSAHILAGVNYLKWLDQVLSEHISDKDERVRFVLASYNVGIGHVLDARRLAEKYGKDPNVWKDNVDYFLLNKSQPKYYQDPVVRFGYARGVEPFNYVNEIMERYAHYRNAMRG